MTVPFSSKLIQTPDTLINVIEGEAVLLNLDNESYYGLNEIGTRMWELLTSSESIQEAFDRLQEEYDVDAKTLQHDLQNMIDKLVTNGLVEVCN